MAMKPKVVFKLIDVPFIESPDCTMRDSIMVTEETCGAQQYSAGLFFVRSKMRGHADKHQGQEELYYIFAGQGIVMVDDEPHKIEAGDVVFIPDGSTHYLINNGNETLSLFWAMAKKWSSFPDIQAALSKWHQVKPGSDWSSLP